MGIAGVRVAILGAGRMGRAIGLGALRCGAVVYATRGRRELLDELRRLGFHPVESNREAARIADVVVISVKPWLVERVAGEIRGVVTGKPVVSVAAGVGLRKLRSLLPGAVVYRAMPNLGALVGLSATALCCKGGGADELIEKLFRCIGEVFWVEEKLFPAWTGLAGSGPGIVALLADALLEAGVYNGLRSEEARLLVSLVLEATGRLLREKHPALLRDEVATPAGTTIEGIRVLERSGCRGALLDSITAAVEKALRMEEAR